ncbi:MAG: nucleotidyltransferase domain-containing protein [Fervidicoccaceae archaeon]|jgi:predicted nucleotidyltransferase
MVRDKISRNLDERLVVYAEKDLELLREKRKRAERIMRALVNLNAPFVLHGSVARGDVHERSDIDIAFLEPLPSYLVEISLEKIGEKIYERKIVQATPASSPKAYIVLDPEELVVVSFPLVKLQPRELEFYKFGGAIGLDELIRDFRIPGVNKKLELVRPVEVGYVLSSIIGKESEVASMLRISIDTVMERVRVLSRRDEIGRTGVYINESLLPGESFEQRLKELAERKPALRRVILERW